MQGGILSIDTAPDAPHLLATAGADGTLVLFDREAGRIRAQLTGHSKKINSAQLPTAAPLFKIHLAPNLCAAHTYIVEAKPWRPADGAGGCMRWPLHAHCSSSRMRCACIHNRGRCVGALRLRLQA